MGSQSEQEWQLTKKTVLQRNCHMFNNPLMSDVKFTCRNSKQKYFYAHKYVLATSSPVFYAMFYGDLAETSSVIHLPDTDGESMEEFLRFLYTDECNLTANRAVNILYLSKKYMITTFTKKCVEEIQSCMRPSKVFTVLEQAKIFDENELVKNSWKVVFSHTTQAVMSESFNHISNETLTSLLQQETLNVKEVDLFNAVLKWTDEQCSRNGLATTGENRRATLGDILHQLRFLSMSLKEFGQYVVPSNLLTKDETLSIYDKFSGAETPVVRETPTLNETSARHLYGMRFRRFLDKVENIQFVNDRLHKQNDVVSFRVSEKAVIHGVRFLAVERDGAYDVTLKANDEEVNGTYFSENNQEHGYGFDVLLQHPVTVREREIITIHSTTIRLFEESPTLHNIYVGNEKASLTEANGVKVTFVDMSETENTTTDQINQIIISRYNISTGLSLSPDWDYFT